MTPLEEIAPEDESRAFYKQSPGKKAIVLAAGSTVHFLIAIALIFGSALAIGRAVEKSPGLETIASCVPVAADQTCEDPGALPSPAEQAGLRSGDVVVAVDGEPVDGLLPFVNAVRDAPERPVVLTVERDGAREDLTVTPVSVERPPSRTPRAPRRWAPSASSSRSGRAPSPWGRSRLSSTADRAPSRRSRVRDSR
jgi:membrane-associated protease RseP (regulator of RpoE activity)